MKIIDKIYSTSDKSIKVLQITNDNFIVETGVFDDGNTCHLCMSSQIGCPISCQMCYNGINKNFVRNLTFEEIKNQAINIISSLNLLGQYEYICFSFMGVGEPLLNYENVLKAIKYLNNKYENVSFALATTLPNVGMIKILTNDFNEIDKFKLTISLHASNDRKRNELIPVSSSMNSLRIAMDYYKKYSIHKGEFNYVLLKDFNDSEEDFLELLEFLEDDDRLKISTYNQIENSKFNKSSEERYELLHKMLNERNIHNSKFESVGDKIDVGCGQMAAKKLERIMKNV
jgi:23S rRNA (adenine2503-C2)-methyltransferase